MKKVFFALVALIGLMCHQAQAQNIVDNYRWVAVYHASGEKQEREVVNFYIDNQLDHPMVVPTKQGNTI